MQRAKALALKEFIDQALPGGRTIVELARDSTAGYKVEHQPANGGEGFTLEDIRSSEAFVKGFQCGRGQAPPNGAGASNGLSPSVSVPDGALPSEGNEPELAEAGSGRGRAR